LLGLSGLPKEATQLFASTNALHAGMRCGLLFGLPIWRPKPPSFAPRGLDGARPAHILNLPLIVGTEHQGADMPEDVLLHVILAAMILAKLRGIGMKRLVEGTDRR
jgi:hypothetical protein